MNCNSCNIEYDEHATATDMPFCTNCYIKWDIAYKMCLTYAGIKSNETDDNRFATSSDTYTVIASQQVQECLSSLTTRDPVYEESLDSFRRRQYKKLNKFDITKVDVGL